MMLKVYFDTTDYSLEAMNYLDGTISETLTVSNKILVGYNKPINAFFVEFATANSSALPIQVQYYNGTTFVDLEKDANDLVDKTFGLSKSGHISWGRNIDDEEKTTVNSIECYWYQIITTVDSDALIIDGINMLLSDDRDIESYEPHLLNGDYYPAGTSSFVGYRQGARNEIIQRLRNQGKGKYNDTDFKDLNVFDLLDWTQLNTASNYLAIGMIYFNLSDAPEDKYYQKYLDYRTMYNEAFNLFRISIDENDDGKESEREADGIQYKMITRI